MKRVSAVTFLALALAFPAGAEELWLYWPSDVVKAAADLEIEEVLISVACGQFRAIRNIPEDWNLEVVRPVSAQVELNASAGHGPSHLQNMQALNGVVAISVDGADCFDVSARVVSFSAERKYSKAQLQLKPDSNQYFSPTYGTSRRSPKRPQPGAGE